MKVGRFSGLQDLITAFNEAAYNKADYKSNKDEILILLKEFARRNLLWMRDMEERGVVLEKRYMTFMDVAYELTGSKLTYEDIEPVLGGKELKVYFTDKLMLSAYYNFLEQEAIIRNMGYDLPNPYTPYIELMRNGGYVIRYVYSRLEVYPGYGVVIHPEEKYMLEETFWSGDLEEQK